MYCLGGFREVGRNAVVLESNRERIVLDTGLKVETGEGPLPMPKINHAFLAHAHLDHCGSLPTIFRQGNPKVYATAASFDQAHLLLKDSIKVARLKGRAEPFTSGELEHLKENENIVTYGQQIETDNFVVEVWDAGHIPGSCMFIVEVEGKRILYTSDFNTAATRLLNGARGDFKDIDIVIMESTYSNRDHPPRAEMERRLFEAVHESILNNGVAILPVFAVGRGAEIMTVLDSFKPDFPVYLDGMAREATEITTHYPELLRDPKALARAYDKTIPLYTDDERRAAISKPCAVVTTGGVLDGGPVINYIKQLWNRPECSLVFSGFQIPRSAGSYLRDTGRFVHEDIDLVVKMKREYLDFSAHCGREQLIEFVKTIRPSQKVICLHGDYCEKLATELKGRFALETLAPRNGDVLEL